MEDVESSEADCEVLLGKEHALCLSKRDLMLETLRPETGDNEKGGILPEVKGNPTYIPDGLRKTLTPLFLIRHSLLVVVDSDDRRLHTLTPMRPEDEDFEFQCTLKWTRIYTTTPESGWASSR